MRTFTPRSRTVTRIWWAALLAATVALVGAPAASARDDGGAVYTQTNDAVNNELVVFDRARNGTLRELGRVSTGGEGQSAPEAPILDSQGGVELTPDEKLLFVVNAGSNEVSSFRVRPRGLPRLVDKESTRGTFPLSVDSLADERRNGRPGNEGLVYVLNETSGDIFGLRYSRDGELTPINGSRESLSVPGPTGRAAQIGFNGRTLTVTRRGTVLPAPIAGTEGIDTFLLRDNDRPGPAMPNASPGGPFGFAYDSADHLIVSDSHRATASSFRLRRSGMLNHISTDGPTGIDPCWVVITPDDRYVFTTDAVGEGTDNPPINFGPGTISRFSLSPNGRLNFLGKQTTPTPGVATDAALSPDGRFLYVVKPDPFGTGNSRIDTLRVRRDGSLTFVEATRPSLPITSSGLAASEGHERRWPGRR